MSKETANNYKLGYKLGDKVVIVKRNNSEFKKGTVGTISTVFDNYYSVTSGSKMFYFSDKHLKPYSQAEQDAAQLVKNEVEYIKLILKVLMIDPKAAQYLAGDARQLKDFDPLSQLDSCFVWDQTPQGWDFWSDINMRINQTS